MNAEQLARALGFKRSGNQWVGCCVAHDDKNPSMIIFEGRNGSAQVRCLAGCDSIDIIEVLRERGLWRSAGDLWCGNEMPWDEDDARRWASTPRADPNRHQVRALQIWDEMVDPRGTPAQDYIKGRGLELPASCAVSVLRYHPRCPQGRDVAPALVVLMRDVITFKPCAIQRLYLTQDVSGTWVKTGAMMLGPAGNAAMMLTSRHDTFWDDLSFCPQLTVCEGLETGLALLSAGHRCVWALGSAGAIARFPVIFAVGELIICADHDENGTSQRAAAECAKRWNATTHQRARIVMPKSVGTDFADAYQRGGLGRGG